MMSHIGRSKQYFRNSQIILSFHTCVIQVLTRAMLGCVSELQMSLSVASDLSPGWIFAAAKRFGPRLDALCHIFLLQPQLATSVSKQMSNKEQKEMVSRIKRFVEEVRLHPNWWLEAEKTGN